MNATRNELHWFGFRYAWIKRHLLEFEDRLGSMFPQNWEVSERIAVQFCHNTREELSKIMNKRKAEMDVKLLLYAIQKTAAFETLLVKRFTSVTLGEHGEHVDAGEDLQKSPFHGLIGKHECFSNKRFVRLRIAR